MRLISPFTNLQDSFSSLFREIGTTLEDVAKQGISVAGETAKTAIAKNMLATPEAQAAIARYKMDYFLQYLPWLIVGIVSVFLIGKVAGK